MNETLKRIADEDLVELRNNARTSSPKTPRLDTEAFGNLSQIRLGLYIDPTLGEDFPDLPICSQFRFSKTDTLFPSFDSCRAMVYFVRDKDVLKDKDLPQGIPLFMVVFDEKMNCQMRRMPQQGRPEHHISAALQDMVYEMIKRKKMDEKEMKKKTPPNFMEFQQRVLTVLRRFSTSFTVEDFEKSFSRTRGPNVSTFFFKDIRSMLVAIPAIHKKGETFYYMERDPIYDATGLQKMQDEIYEVIKDFQGPFSAKAVSTAYFSRYWEEIRFGNFGSRFTNLTAFLLAHPAMESAVADGSDDQFKIRDPIEKESEQWKNEKLKALQARILKVAKDLSMPFVPKGIEDAYEKHFKEKLLSPTEFGYESLSEFLKDHPDFEKVEAIDFDVVCFKLKNADDSTKVSESKNWLLFQLENVDTEADMDNHLTQPFPLNAAMDSSWKEFCPQISQFLKKHRPYEPFLVDGMEWLYKPGEDECLVDEEKRDEQISHVMRFLGGKASVDILQRTFHAMFKRRISISDVVAMVSSNSKDYHFAWLLKSGWGEYKKDSYVVDKRFHGSDGLEQNMRRFTQAINNCGDDASFRDVHKRWGLISGLYVYPHIFMEHILGCKSLEEARELFSNKILFTEFPQEEEEGLRIQNKSPIHRIEMEEGTRRLLEILKETDETHKMAYYDVRQKYKATYGVDFNEYEIWRYFEVTKHRYLGPLLAKTPIRACGTMFVYFWLDKNEEEEHNQENENMQVNEPNSSRKRKAEEPIAEQAMEKKVADMAREAEDNVGGGCSVAAKETLVKSLAAKPLENEVEDVHSKKNAIKFKEEAVQTEPSDQPSVPMDASSSAPPHPVALPPTSKHAPLGNLVAQMLDYAEYKGKNTEELGTKILKMIIESSE